MSGLLIQHARWQGELVTPDDTRLETGAKCNCVCIGCGEPLILRRGEKKRWHFAHRAKTSCGGETYIHKVVKTWIAEKLIGQTIPLSPHPELDSPQGFYIESGEIEKYNNATKRQYDVVLKGIFSYSDTDQVNHDELIFEVHYSNPKDDCFKLQSQEWKFYILEVDAKTFYGDGREKFTIETLLENNEWVWFTDNQKLWCKYGLKSGLQDKNNVRDIVTNWITEEYQVEREEYSELTPLDPEWKPYNGMRPNMQMQICTYYRNFGIIDKHQSDGPLRSYGYYRLDGDFFGLTARTMSPPLYFDPDKCWKGRYSKKMSRRCDIVFQGDFVWTSVRNRRKALMIFQLVKRLGEHSEKFKRQIREAKFCVLEVDIHGFFADGLEPPTGERFTENTQWVW